MCHLSVRQLPCFLVVIACCSILAAAEPTLTPAFTFADVDVGTSGIVTQGRRTPLGENLFRLHFQRITKKPPSNNESLPAGSQIVLAFRQPLVIGTAMLSSGDSDGGEISVQILDQSYQGKVGQATDDDWRKLSDVETFAQDFRASAIRLILKRDQHGPFAWLAWKERLTNLTASAVGSGEKAPFGSHPNSIPLGQAWVNTDRDPRPGAPKQLQRGSVSEALPSWYLLSWDTPQSIASLWLSCNADRFNVYAYRGVEGLNPAVAPDDSWRRIDFVVVHEQLRDGDRLHDRLLAFNSLKTVALKLEMTGCKSGAVAKIRRMSAFSTSGEESGPEATIPSGKPISIEQPFDGQLAVVVTDEAGRHIRNLVAQVDRRRGRNAENWDLKDESGLMVPPGKYRWKAITSPPIGVRYQIPVYPNAPQIFAGQTPWLTGESGANGWLADHASITSGASTGDRLFFGSPGVENGVCLIECDLTGRKLWGKHSFAPFSGVGRLAADSKSVYIQERDSLHRLDPQTRKIERIAALTTPERQGHLVGMTAHQGTLALSLNAPEPWLENATRADVVDLEHCLPKFAEKIANPLGNRRVDPIPRLDFLRLLRLTGTPAGQGATSDKHREMHFPITIDSVGEGKYQYVVLAFNEPIPLGSVILPSLGADYLVDLAVLKPQASYPPNPNDNSQWQPAEETPRAGSWTCVAMPAQVRTRGLRLRIRRAKEAAEDNLIDDVLAASTDKKKGTPEFDLDKPAADKTSADQVQKPAAKGWFASFEGLKLLRRRFDDLTPEARIRVNSGEINAAGEWDAQRSEPLSTDDPGVYVMQWAKATKLAALAIKEIDGAVTEIDIWDEKATGQTDEDPPLTDSAGWKHVATYHQARRDAYEPSFERNNWARYMDGYVSLGGEVSTRAIRLRVTSQWSNLNDRGTATLRFDRGGRELDRRRCRIFGVAALGYLGDETPLDTLSYRRVELRDGGTGKLLREFTAQDQSGASAESPKSLVYRADGELFGIQLNRVVRINTESGITQPELPEIDGQNRTADRLAIAPDGTFYVFVQAEKNIRVYDRDGRFLRTVGKPGGQVPGPWDAEKFRQVEELIVDAKRQLWVVESQNVPRRIVQYDATGKLVHEFYGNTGYGGGGVLDPTDKTRLFFNHIEFALDWDTGTSRIKNMLAEWMPDDCVPIRYEGRTYLASAPLSHSPTQQVASIYLYDPQRGTAAIVAAFGEADAFQPLQIPSVLRLLDAGKAPKDYTFTWSDRNGDAHVDADEVVFEAKASGTNRLQLGRLNSQMRCWGGSRVYAPSSILPNGVPLFEASSADRSGTYELNDGNLLSLGALADAAFQTGDGNDLENHAVDRQGKALWRYPTSYAGVSGLYLPPWKPGYVTNEFGVIGHEVASSGDLGEFVVVHGNNGMWKIWTADGMLAGQILRHKFDPRSIVDSSSSTVKRGQVFDDMTAGQEHFHGNFVKAPDGKNYIVHGHNYIAVWEVLGLDKFKRMSGEITVTPEDVRKVRKSQEEFARREVKSQAKILECLKVKSGGEIPIAAEVDGVKFSLGYDDQSLYVSWDVSQQGVLRNSGTDFHRYFKTGACLDLQLGVDAQAAANRQLPVAGDLRLLFTVVDGKPRAVIYRPTAADADSKDAWETRTDAGGTVRFDSVAKLVTAKLTHTPDPRNPDNHYTFTAVIPLGDLNWTPQPGQLLRGDWGVLSSDDGHTVKRRFYWSNSLATGTSDEAWEARLDPHLWGTLLVSETSRAERQLEKSSLGGKKKPNIGADILDDILNDLDKKKK